MDGDLAEPLGFDSLWLSEHHFWFDGFLGALGLKVVGRDQVCIDRAIYESYKTLATAALTNPAKLNWDEPE